MLPRVWWGRRNWGRREFREIQRTICQRRRRRRTYRSTCLPGSDADRCRIPTHLVRPDNFKHGRKALWKGQLSGISTVTFPNNGRASPSSDPQGSPEGSEACSSFDRVPVRPLRGVQGGRHPPCPGGVVVSPASVALARRPFHARRAVLHDLDAALPGRLRRGRCACPPPPLAPRAYRGFRPHRRPLRVCRTRLHFADRL